VTVIGVDPGSTTGLCIVTVDKSWLRGAGDPSWQGLGQAVKSKVAYQIGREAKMFLLDKDRSTKLDTEEVNERLLPILQDQPLYSQDGMRSTERFEEILNGMGGVSDGGLLYVDAEEVVQVRQMAGLFDNYAEAALVWEDFTARTDVTSRETFAPDRLRASSQAQEILHGEGRAFFLQSASDMKNTAMPLKAPSKTVRDYDRLKRAGLYFAGMPHATEAAGHVALFLRRARRFEEIRTSAWPTHFVDHWED
jgi:hypothetical protein